MTGEEFFIYCLDDEVIRQEISKIKNSVEKVSLRPFSMIEKTEKGAFINNNEINFVETNHSFSMSIFDLALQGRHNTYNSMAAGIAGNVLKIRKEMIRESLSDFQGVEHRLEHVLRIHNIDFINDSKATNVNSTWYALESMTSPTVWIVGGIDKGNDYTMLHELVKQKVKAIICLGVDNAKLINNFANLVDHIEEARSMQEAVSKAYRLASKGDTVLMSPACASFDLFDNFEDRGWQFKNAVRHL